jgi:hypothetical protein
MKNDKSDRLKRWCFATCAALFILLYGYGALEHSKRINLDVDRVDQAAYLSYARNLYETNYNYVGGRNRMPVYPFLLSLIYSPTLHKTNFLLVANFSILPYLLQHYPVFSGYFRAAYRFYKQ